MDESINERRVMVVKVAEKLAECLHAKQVPEWDGLAVFESRRVLASSKHGRLRLGEGGVQNSLGNPFCTCHEYEHFTCESEKHK